MTTQLPQPASQEQAATLTSAIDILAKNSELTEQFYGNESVDKTISPEEERAAKRRRSIQLSHGPFAPQRDSKTDIIIPSAGPSNGREATGAKISDENEKQHALVPKTTKANGEHGTRPEHRLTAAAPTSTQSGIIALRVREARLAQERPTWHPPWRPYRIMSGHLGWVRCIAFDPSNDWFVTGSADRTIKVWDSASGKLKLTLTGHVAAVRALVISSRHPYMFSVGEDKSVKCWDLEQNKVIRNYHGHLSGVYCASLHPTLDVLMTGGRDSTVRVWDIRTRMQVHVLGGHRDTVNSVFTQAVDPQIVSASVDSTVRLWDLAAGRCRATLTNHKKGVRALAAHPREFSFASASADNIKTWGLPEGVFMRNLSNGHGGKLVNAIAVNEDGVLVSGGDDGMVGFWDYSSAHRFDEVQSQVQPGSLECEAGIYALAFDKSGSRLVSGETDKTVRMWREDESATEETHPLNWTPSVRM